MTSASQGFLNLIPKPQQPRDQMNGDVFVEPQTLAKAAGKVYKCPVPTESQQDMGSLTTPTKGRNVPSCEPWTPTSNLKMLISAASPEIRNREKGRCEEAAEPEISSQDLGLGEESEKISRKEKSLGLLCHKFLARYPDYPNPAVNNDICLDDVAGELNVERRRIYDIMNVLESLHMVSRLAKNRYTWHGRSKLPQTLATLRKVGEEQRYGQQMQQIRQHSFDQELDFDEEKENEEFLQEMDGEGGQKEMCFVELPGVEFKGASVNSRKDKSLRVMSQKFVMLFLVSTPRVVSLDVAAKILIGEDQIMDRDKNKFKTKIRRLYDIANVLSSLELIKKVHVTEDRGRKPAFKWTGPEDLPPANVPTTASVSSASRTLEPRSSIDNCTKNLFSSPGEKRGFTRHHSLVKLAKSIQDDRRKINSAPTSPIKIISNDSSYPSKMAQLAAICKIQLDQQSKIPSKEHKISSKSKEDTPGSRDSLDKLTEKRPVSKSSMSVTEPQAKSRSVVQLPVLPAGALPYLPHQCSPLIPVLLPQQQVRGPYAVYVAHPPPRPVPSFAVRSMTFESPGDCTKRSPVASGSGGTGPRSSPKALKRPSSGKSSENSPKVRRSAASSKGASPTLGEILQSRLQSRRASLGSNRPSSRALHLDPEFTKPTEGQASANSSIQPLEHSVETYLEKEERSSTSEPELALTPLHPAQTLNQTHPVPLQEVVVPSGRLHAETLIPTGYLIPISQPPILSFKESHPSNGEAAKASTPTYNVYHTPTAGSRPLIPQEFTPTSLTLHRAPQVSPYPRAQSPSPAILNFTMQNMGLIPAAGSPLVPEQASPLPTSHVALPQRGMVFIKPLSPAGPLQHPQPNQPLTLISLQQPLLTTPKGPQCIQHSLFHTPVSTLTAMTTPVATKTVFIPQRKLDVSPEDSLNQNGSHPH
ncbi:transcription factor E2F8-like isoform X2 [Denticeps clupeoides]|uniref:transcription factor E2F8-like isoform X2 n=1 Tax=Denticeps clupeoides TaxID=299321 RepID=UPI0010A593FA|nr:transcription factor E2F8-like isoform X2 [Denticeps clupeoides]